MIKPMVVVFCYIEVDVILGDKCGIGGHLRSFWEMKCLQGCFKIYWKILRLTNLTAEVVQCFWVQVTNQDYPRSVPVGGQFPIPGLQNLFYESIGGIKFVILVENFDTGGPSLITVRKEYLFAVQFLFWEVSVGNQWGMEAGSTVLFLYMVVLWWSVGEG